MTGISIFVAVVLLATQLVNFLLRRKYNILEESQPINHKQKIVKHVFTSLFIVVIILLTIYSSLQLMMLTAAGLTILYTGYQFFIEYKGAYEEKQYVFHLVRMIGTVIVFIGILYITQRTVPLEKVVQEEGHFNPGEVERLEIDNYTWKEERTDDRSVTIEDPELINRLFDMLYKLELRKWVEDTSEWDEIYRMEIRYQPIQDIDVSEKLININYTTYEIVGDNPFYEFLEEMDLEWEEEEGI
ncbi:DUF4181 domain-containing protein [Oceanobacillus manasiensis]|uniref:DUF4181 domain-containing protein n=1 Tax=Oceanobacillus manasiensis TaxID=586413 RepID=UPI0005A835CE|nr:DUF4181 domain-containing protein [Oceanobacillus manasiensis]